VPLIQSSELEPVIFVTLTPVLVTILNKFHFLINLKKKDSFKDIKIIINDERLSKNNHAKSSNLSE
jgi:uncharacterized protein involved in tellurium resistance